MQGKTNEAIIIPEIPWVTHILKKEVNQMCAKEACIQGFVVGEIEPKDRMLSDHPAWDDFDR